MWMWDLNISEYATQFAYLLISCGKNVCIQLMGMRFVFCYKVLKRWNYPLCTLIPLNEDTEKPPWSSPAVLNPRHYLAKVLSLIYRDHVIGRNMAMHDE